ncbi:hypothetical protein ACF0H5_005549 [Mactra antiquata]
MGYKQEHEAFVSDNPGTTVIHIALTGIACLLPVYIRDVCCVAVPVLKKFKDNLWLNYLIDFITVIIPLQFFMSSFAQYYIQCFVSGLLIFIVIFSIKLQNSKIKSVYSDTAFSSVEMGSRRPFINYYRAYANVITAFSILAVDFKIFPRYFAKVETYGTGLMDVGVGGFLISNAVVSPEARKINSPDRAWVSILKSVKSSMPLIVIGLIRVLAVKSADYQEHVTEYGVHWNFFFTLATVKIACTVLFCAISPKMWKVAGVLIIAAYQHNLMYDGLRNYLIKGYDGKGGRTDIIDANREGLYSCFGFLSIYIMGIQLGNLVMKKREKVKDWILLCISLSLVSTGCWILLYCSEKYVEPISRRFANLSYLLWMLAFNSMLLTVFLLFDIIVFYLHYVTTVSQLKESPKNDKKEDTSVSNQDTCDLISAVNYNGLFYFLFANLLTGSVNMLVKTIYQSDLVAMAILTTYMFILSAVTYILYKRKLSLKFW